jgi:hypothetical protein
MLLEAGVEELVLRERVWLQCRRKHRKNTTNTKEWRGKSSTRSYKISGLYPLFSFYTFALLVRLGTLFFFSGHH